MKRVILYCSKINSYQSSFTAKFTSLLMEHFDIILVVFVADTTRALLAIFKAGFYRNTRVIVCLS